MNHSTFLTCATLLATPLAAQQFQIELTRDVLGQKSIYTLQSPSAGDLNGDGRVDLLFAGSSQFPNPNTLYLNNHQYFTPTSLGVAPGGGGRATLLDIDGDGDLDVLQSLGLMRLLRNNGLGGMTDISATHLPSGVNSFGRAASSDIDGDGDPDVLMPQGKILVNDGAGLFTDETATLLSSTGFSIGLEMAIADFDSDGDEDFVIMSGLHRNNGAGVFTHDPAANIQHGYGEIPFAFDADMDGDVDVLTTSGRFLQNNGAGVFLELANLLPAAQPNQPQPWSIGGFGDLNGDGAWDMLLTPYSSALGDLPAWAANNGQGTFAIAQAQLLPCEKVRMHDTLVVDLDADGDNDLVVCDGDHLRPSPAEVLFNDGTGTFFNGTELGGLWTPRTYGRIVADLDGDGDEDILAGSTLHRNDGKGSLTRHYLPNSMSGLLVADFDGDGDIDTLGSQSIWFAQAGLNYTSGSALVGLNERVTAAAAADIDGDSDLDLVLIAGPWSVAPTLRVLINDGTANFTAATTASMGLTMPNPATVATGDFNGDGSEDLMFGFYGTFIFGGAPMRLFANDGAGQFQQLPMPQSQWSVRNLHVADFEGDGDLDVVTDSPNLPILHLNDGSGQFSIQTLSQMGGHFLHPDDVDLDGDVDLWTSGSGWPRVYINDGNNTFTHAPSRVDPAQARHLSPEFVLIDLDRDGDRDVVTVCEDNYTQSQYYVPMWNHIAQLRAPRLTIAGGTMDLFLSAIEAQPAPPVAFIGVSAQSADVYLGELGLLGIDLPSALMFPVLMTANTASLSLNIPNDRALLGLPLHAQTLLATTTQLRLTNTITTVIIL